MPSEQEIDAAIKRVKDMAYIRSRQGSDKSKQMAVLAAIEWTAGRKLTGDWQPYWIENVLGTHS